MIYARLIEKMTEYYRGDTKRIQHFLKVLSYAETIGKLENLEKHELHILKTAAIVHDIGIKTAEEKYHSSSGNYQEIEGPSIAREMLLKLNFESDVIERVCWLIAHHHTYSNIKGNDYQILVEADFLVNMCEDRMDTDAILSAYRNIFKTKSGRRICQNLFALNDESLSHVTRSHNTANTASESEISLQPMVAANISPAYMVTERCNGCGTCIDVCPKQCIDIRRKPAYIIQEMCIHCGSCAGVCDKNAIARVSSI